MHIKHILVSLLFATLFFAWGCFRKQPLPGTSADSLKPVQTGAQTGQETGFLSHPDPGQSTPVGDTLIQCSGILEIPSSNRIYISTPVTGVVNSISCCAGKYVQGGTVVATLESIVFLILQQEYLEAKSQFFFFSEEMKRQGELTIENASSVKKLQQTQLAFQVWEAKFHSLKQQLILTGFVPDSVDVDHLSPLITILAPESGYIERIVATKGRRIDPGDRLLEMVRDNQIILTLEIPEKYFTQLKVGQKLEFYLPSDSSLAHKAKLTYIHRRIEPVSRVFRAVAIPDGYSANYVSGMHIRAQLLTGRD